MQLYGRLQTIHGSALTFANDLKQNLDKADAVSASIKKTIDGFIAKHAIAAPTEPPYQPVWQPESEPCTLLNCEQAGIQTVIWSTGYTSDFQWIDIPVFDGRGYPGHRRGVTSVSGLYFLGLPWLYTWGSGRFSGVARDAQYLADCIVARQKPPHSRPWDVVNEYLLGS
jgi:putative flavoprotein involved in K+ transport